MDIVGSFYSALKGFRNAGLILWLVVWKADRTETQQLPNTNRIDHPKHAEN